MSDPVARAHPQSAQHSCETRGCLEQIGVGPSLAGAGNRAVVDDRRPRTVPGRNVTVDRVDARVQPAVWKPSVQRRRCLVQDLRGARHPNRSRPLLRARTPRDRPGCGDTTRYKRPWRVSLACSSVGVGGVRDVRGVRGVRGVPAAQASRAANWPQAPSISRPRVSRTVTRTPASDTPATNSR